MFIEQAMTVQGCTISAEGAKNKNPLIIALTDLY